MESEFDHDWDADHDITFHITESLAWEIMDIQSDNNGQWDCFSPELVEKNGAFLLRNSLRHKQGRIVMMLKTRTYIRDGVTITEQVVPHLFVVVDTYHPCQSTVPWDCYGRDHQKEIKRVLINAGIESVDLCENHVNNAPAGSGRGGMVRFGDNMMPGVYRVAVPKERVDAAMAAIAQHKKEVEAWIQGGARPLAMCGG